MDNHSNLTNDELYQIIGRELAARDLSATPPSLKDMALRGKQWMEDNQENLCKLFCRSARVQQLCESSSLERDGLVVLMDIAAHATIGVPPFAASLLFIRLGYHKLCPKYVDSTH
jgi:hypothetical protein